MAGNFNDPGDLDLTWTDLVLALSACRDALTDLSLALRDHLFEVDSDTRQKAGELEQELTDKLREQLRQAR
jgi:hypothetical protein